MTREVDVYPAAVQINGPNGQRTLTQVRVVASGSRAVALKDKAGVVEVVLESNDVTMSEDGGHTILASASTGDTWRVMQQGGCGCGDKLKNLTATQLESYFA